MTHKITPLSALACAALFVGGGLAEALETKLTVTETDKVARTPAVVTTGVPFARGELKDVAKLAVKAGGKALPAQFLKTVAWDDGSVRWALVDVQVDVPAGGKAELVLSDAGGNPAPAAPVKVDDGAEAVRVSTGPLAFVISKKKPGLFESVKVDGKELITSAGRGLVVLKAEGGDVQAGAPTEVVVEQAGTMRAIVCAKGKFPGVHNDLLAYTVRVSAFAGCRHLKVQVWIENQGSMGLFRAKGEGDASPNAEWFAFKGLCLDLGLGLGDPVAAKCEGAEGTGSLRVSQICHMAKSQQSVKNLDYVKPPFYTYDDFEYTITGGGKELKKGDRTDGLVELKGQAGRLTAALRDFWQNYEKAVELDGKSLRFWFWPEGRQWPRPRPRLTDGGLFDRTLQGLPKPGLYLLPGSVHKGHELVLDFSGRDARESLAELSAPLFALAAPEYYAATEAAPALFAPPEARTAADKDCNAKLAAWMRMTASSADPASPSSLWSARKTSVESGVGYISDSSNWFGWMEFGDLGVPGRGHVSLHYDWTWIMWLNLMRTGDPSFARLGASMARHRIDIDELWSDRELAECRGLQRSDYNFPSYHCNRLYYVPDGRANWISGVALYYMLTGEPKALECCLRNGEGLRAAWDWVAKAKAWGGPQGDMAANGWGMFSFCTLYDLTADRKWLDEGLKLFNANVVPKWKGLGPHLHDGANQIQSQDYIQEDLKYCHAIVPLCELHRRTGDETVFKLLKEGCEKPFPDSFFEAPRYLADLFAYVGMKSGKPEYLETAADLFAQSFPESKCPPVFLLNNSTWSRDAGMTLRTGHLLQYAHWKAAAKK
ncbi:MAG TPA: hypothetical protein PK280_00365 [Planctomycetota bacterium]|nr:hypothetical protein [Planctomycetota bacterium]